MCSRLVHERLLPCLVREPTTVVIRLNTPSAVFEESVAMRVFIIPKHVWTSVTDPTKYRDPKATMGSGPYKLQSADEAAGYRYMTTVMASRQRERVLRNDLGRISRTGSVCPLSRTLIVSPSLSKVR